MAYLHYGLTMQFELDAETIRRAIDAIGGHATRGGWVTFSDVHARQWSILVTAGIPIWVEPDAESAGPTQPTGDGQPAGGAPA